MAAGGGQDDDVLRDILAPVYIVVMCCGLGGAIVLFLIFATMPHAGQALGRQQASVTSLGRDLASAGIGARMQDLAHFGMHDVMRIRLELQTKALASDAIDFPQMDSTPKFLEANAVPTKDGIQFWSPLSVHKRQTRIIQMVLKNPPAKGLKCSGRLLIVAGGQSTGEIPLMLSIATTMGQPTILGIVNVNDKRGPEGWFQPASGVQLSGHP